MIAPGRLLLVLPVVGLACSGAPSSTPEAALRDLRPGRVEEQATAAVPDPCPRLYHREGDRCVPDPCPRGYHPQGDDCAPDPVPPGPMVQIPGGTFVMGSHCPDPYACPPPRTVLVSPFAIDLTEVTVGAFRACVDAGRCPAPRGDGACNWGRDFRERHPIDCVDWDAARAYCAWAGKRLPTEAEWEFAAVGHTGWTYPWGNDPANRTRVCVPARGLGPTCEVGSVPAGRSRFGLLDMTGNAMEWTADVWCLPGPSSRCDATMRVVRTGDPAGARMGVKVDTAALPFGFRCAKG